MAAVAADAVGMTSLFAEFAARLQTQAELIGAARAQERQLARTDPAARWRRAKLLWPRFTQG